MFDFIRVTKPLVLFLIIVFLNISCTSTNDLNQNKKTNYSPVNLFNTELRTIHSKIVKQDYDIYISLPYSYYFSEKSYPVLLNLDANITFGITQNSVRLLSTLNMFNKPIPEMIVIGIAYPIKGIEDWAALRCRDFRPTENLEKDKAWQQKLSKLSHRNDIIVKSGGADNFLEFIREELIPFIETNYRVLNSDRGITGYSASGLFLLYSLLKNPATFNKYFAASPSINWDENYMYKLENDFAALNKDLPVKLYISIGEKETESYIKNFNKMIKLLHSRNYPNLKLESQILKGEIHSTSYSTSIGRALEFLYLE